MALPSGARLGPFEIIGLLGAGGMGEVYRATDTHLKRAVAIKVLPAAVSADPARLARSQREAEMLAALNHPNIGAIYGLERCEGLTALVLELVEGPTLADRIAQGAVRLDEALPIAVQIADALEAAHDRGIVHRDLKPANIKVRPDGTVKVLDFGLAKASHVEGGPGSTPYDASMSPTMAAPAMTEAGLILGTVAYMSPEQARGKAVGKQADIWAFGCVLYEMLSGRMAFHGETVSDTIAAVLGREPDWAALPSSTPANIRQLLRHLLAKDPKRRLRDAGDVRLALTELATPERDGQSRPPDSRDVPARRTRTSIVAAVLAGVALGALGVLAISARGASDSLDTSAYRFTPLAADPADEGSPAWSPDGKAIVYVAEKDGVRQLFVRSLDGAVPTQITKSATDCSAPFWSHDGRRIFFIDVGGAGGGAGQLRSVGVAGGEPQLVLNDVAAATIAPDDETLAFLRGPGGSRSLWTTALGAGEPRRYETAPFPATFGLSSSVQFSPDGKSLAVLVRRQDGASYRSQLWVLPYPTGTPRPVLDGIPEAAEGA